MRRLLTHCEEWWDYCSVASGLDVPSTIGTHVSAKMVEATAKSATCSTTRGVIAQVRGISTCMQLQEQGTIRTQNSCASMAVLPKLREKFCPNRSRT